MPPLVSDVVAIVDWAIGSAALELMTADVGLQGLDAQVIVFPAMAV